MPVENVTSFWDSPLFAAIIGVIGCLVGAFIAHWLHVRHERKKERATGNAALQQEIETLKEKVAYYEDFEQSNTGNYYILTNTKQPICPVCWGKGHKAIPVYGNETGNYICGACGKSGAFNHQTVEYRTRERENANRVFQEKIEYL